MQDMGAIGSALGGGRWTFNHSLKEV
jgi:hypothetical protein